MNVALEQDFGILSVLVSVCRPSSTDPSHLSGLSLHADKQSIWGANEEEQSGQPDVV